MRLRAKDGADGGARDDEEPCTSSRSACKAVSAARRRRVAAAIAPRTGHHALAARSTPLDSLEACALSVDTQRAARPDARARARSFKFVGEPWARKRRARRHAAHRLRRSRAAA
jgi:hypothetical protein